MKKQGFTLAEFLMTLGVIGVVAAFLIPAISNAMPDGNKALYLKTYDTLSEAIKSLATNSRIYTVCDNTNNVDCSANPLLNVQRPIMSPLNQDARYQGQAKLCNLLALSFGVNTDNTSCTADAYNYSDNTFKDNLSFITKNGMQWKVAQQVYSIADGNAQYQTDIYVDVNGNKGNNCLYSNACQKPDIFKFMVAASGEVVPADPMGRKYLETRNSLLKNDTDIDNTTILTSLEEYKTGLRNFDYTSCPGGFVTYRAMRNYLFSSENKSVPELDGLNYAPEYACEYLSSLHQNDYMYITKEQIHQEYLNEIALIREMGAKSWCQYRSCSDPAYN